MLLDKRPGKRNWDFVVQVQSHDALSNGLHAESPCGHDPVLKPEESEEHLADVLEMHCAALYEAADALLTPAVLLSRSTSEIGYVVAEH